MGPKGEQAGGGGINAFQVEEGLGFRAPWPREWEQQGDRFPRGKIVAGLCGVCLHGICFPFFRPQNPRLVQKTATPLPLAHMVCLAG